MRRTDLGLALAAALLLPVAAFAQGGAGGNALPGIKLSGDEPIQIESDKLEVREADNLAIFTGNVNVVQGKTLLKSGRMIVHYAKQEGASATTGSADIERIEVSDKVYVKSENQVATGDAGTFDMKTDVLTLTGKEVVLSEGQNVLVGCKLTVLMGTGRAQVDGCAKTSAGSGRVLMKIEPSKTKP